MSKIRIVGHASGSGILTIAAPNTDTDRTITIPDVTGTLLDSGSDLPAANLTGSVAAARIANNTIDSAHIASGAIDDAHLATGISASKLTGALPALNGASLTGVAGRRNILINGAMQVWQRATTFSVADNIYTVDRWLTEFGGFGAWTLSRSTDAPAGFGYSLDLDCTTADASPAAGDIFQLFHRLEGQDLQQLKKGTSSAESITFSFWVKSKKTGNLQVNLKDANSRIIGAVYTINVADTWEKKSITFAGDTSGVIANDNTSELMLEFPIGSGSTYSSGAVPTSWEATSTADRNAGATINLADNTANYWRITGLQLELGSVATDFEHRSYGEELALCQRYYRQMEINIGCLPWAGSTGGGFGYTVALDPAMRAAPSVTQLTTPTYSSSITTVPNAVAASSSSVNVNHGTTPTRITIRNNASGGTLFAVKTNNAYDAEL